MMKSHIYKIVNVLTGKTYVGMTVRTLDKRFRAHKQEAMRQEYNMYLHNAIRKHGAEQFRIELIETVDTTIASDRERFWIRYLNTTQPHGYNEHEGGNGGCLNASPQLREKLSQAKIGKPTWNKGYSGEECRLRRQGLLSFFPLDRPKPKAEKKPKTRKKPRQVKMIRFNNGSEEKLFPYGVVPDFPWVKGKLKKGRAGSIPWNKGKKIAGHTAHNKGKPNPTAAENGIKGAETQRASVTGRKLFIREDGSKTWIYPNGHIGKLPRIYKGSGPVS